MSSGGKRGGKAKFYRHKKPSGPPKGGDGQGDFKGGAMTQYRTQPLPEMLCSPGIVVTAVQNKEMIAEREIIDALEEAADDLYPDTEGGMDDGEEKGDIEDMVRRELDELSAQSTRQSQRFRVCKRDTVCMLYINVLPPLDPIALVRHIIERCERTGRCSFRFIQRLTPVSATAHADIESLRRIAAQVLPGPFSGGPKKFGIQVATRNSNALERLQMIKAVAEEVTKLSPEHTVDLKNPDRTIMIELFKTVLGISVVENFEKYKKFNPAAVAREAAKAAGAGDSRVAAATNVSGAADSRVAASRVGTSVSRVAAAIQKGEKERSTGQARAENRVRRMEGIKAAQEAEAAAAEAKARPPKRKAEDGPEDGQVAIKPDDVEQGEAVEDESAELGDDFVEEIQGGRVVKVRRHE
ncbi:hypothetical protein CC85DRAFT_306697 [Cutaneotrichosporon oleaginosum]|uniref:THUMP domain-containing protein n=1 Tax=Cutaneotrichosporon oleaginosum TaxID=879819 RepID=A0A0J0XWS9_9TREE|nr:uncharacterized protein CC85DRAFT_306697 [Cutaneotrichosporon oleaginosum]KLT45515.1 hypothetical protein CC85DRAFT_306697 [Cutaneotrichosporon oleaginosum]TXT14530.1 hypothetical protein COLE_00723 [Cutaneotrichosporon oleaginosum]